MKYKCPHCHSNTFRLLTEADGASVAQCLHCGQASSFTVSTMLDCSGRARLAETVPFRAGRRPTDRKRTYM
jgi:hypothetical protein